MMEDLVILSKIEEEYLVRALEAALHVRGLRQFFLWVQGQFQGLLPHEMMVCIQFAENDKVQRIEYLHSMVKNPGLTKRLCDPVDGLAVRLAHYCRNSRHLPCVIEQGTRDGQHSLTGFQAEISRCQLGNAVVHGTERLRGGSTFFALFSLPETPTVRQAFFLDLLLPSLHLAFLRVAVLGGGENGKTANAPSSLLTAREIEVLRWVTQGKSNYEIGVILELSSLTVKNHMQKIYRKLDVHNRVQAVSRCHALQLFDSSTSEVRG
ncbi:MAG: XrtB/PEP-CTERM-associated transcriptional regulator EpsA [Gallionellaceae bacterium]